MTDTSNVPVPTTSVTTPPATPAVPVVTTPLNSSWLHSPLLYLGLAVVNLVVILVLILNSNPVPTELYASLFAELAAGGVATIPQS